MKVIFLKHATAHANEKKYDMEKKTGGLLTFSALLNTLLQVIIVDVKLHFPNMISCL